ncbi:hypothetical protein AGABI1DRAFT_106270 [Agaricus bisporus var. burnettii JB137-S8]|uniref:Uncharacterized protein n=2 Tax=Agaricus bisporus TaxID=5341 RepID=K5XA59_AGABU|nr:uncharacterized protein AGABI1DRAFT_106270 [Agaricus bisporus var. burnettii JB137-S8]EKM79952.1 hypothetical protein AGABI1DRAFT_106270 [Agaricus bisporus var. burnettii JB137-S8]
MDDESADILGQQTKIAFRSGKGSDNDAWLGTSLIVKLVLGFVIILFLYVVSMQIWFRILVWRERSYKLATRRKHGIPDKDHRPFNVAYAAVLLARREKEATQKAKVSHHIPSSDQRSAERENGLRQRLGRQVPTDQRRASSFSVRFPGAYLTEGSPVSYHPEPSAPPPVSHSTLPVPQIRKTSISRLYGHETPSYFPGSRMSKRDFDSGDERSTRKRGYVEDLTDEQEVIKRSKRANRSEGNGAVRQDQVLPQRVAKRYLFDDDENEDHLIERRPREKRARKVSLDKNIQAQTDQDMDVDEDDDDIDDLPHIQRGKKRDRTEAGSTFGGDDDESGPEQDRHDHKLKRRGRKRRTFSKRTVDLEQASRGQKRDRDLGDDETEREFGEEDLRSSRKKRGKRTVLTEAELSEHSNTPSQRSFSSDRKIGEEWTSNGIRWKIGDNGRRLRQALVKKAGQRFSMPEDSQHPDREADFEVYVESWLSEAEYRDAKSRHLLAGQGTSKQLEPKLGIDIEPYVNGKDLLWSAKLTSSDSPTPGSPESGPDSQRIHRIHRINPFDQTQTHHTRRISSTSRTSSVGTPGLVDSTNSNPHGLIRTYSKLEKQELEARALLRLREMRNAKKVETNQSKADEAIKEKENVEKANTEVSVPTITVTAPTESSNQLMPPGASTLNKSPESTLVTSKQVEPPKPASFFSFPAISKPSNDSKPPESVKPSPFGTSTSTATPAFPFAPSSPSASKADDKATAMPPSSVPQPTSNFFAPSTNEATSLNTQAGKTPGFFNMSSSPSTANNTNAMLESKPASEQAPSSGGNSVSFRLGPQTGTAPPSGPTSQSAFFNLGAEHAKASTPNPFATQSSQSTSPAPTAPATSTNSTGPLKFNFGLTGPSNVPSGSASARPTSAALSTAAPATTTSSNTPFATVAKNPHPSSASFTPFTPNAGTKVTNEVGTSSSATTKSTFNPTGFGFTAPNAPASSSNVSGPPSKPAFGTPSGATSLFNTANTSHNPLFPSTAFGGKSTENNATESSGAKVSDKSPFKFNFGGGQPSSQNSGISLAPSSAGAAKPASSSSSLFNALGNQSSSSFGSTSGPNTSQNANIFGTSNFPAAASDSTSQNIFKSQSAPSGNTTPNVFGNTNTGTNGGFGSTGSKPSETPKSAFSAMPITSAPEQQKSPFQFKLPQPSSTANTNNSPAPALSSTASSSGSTFKFNFELNKNNAPPSTQSPSIFGTSGSNNTAMSSNPSKPTATPSSSVFSAPGPGNSATAMNPFTSTSTQPPSVFGLPGSNSAGASSNPLSTTQSSSIFGSSNTATSSRFALNPATFGSTINTSPFNPLGKASESDTASGQK